MHCKSEGQSLIETMTMLLIISLATAVIVPTFQEFHRQYALQAAARQIGGLLIQCRSHAIFHRISTALVFESQEGCGWRCFIAEDGDGDGVHSDDLERRCDKIVGEIYQLDIGGAGLGILEGVPDPAGGGALGGNLDDPIRAGRGNIITFTPAGTSSSCSIYFTDHRSRMRVLRVLGMTGRVRALEWREGWLTWRRTLV